MVHRMATIFRGCLLFFIAVFAIVAACLAYSSAVDYKDKLYASRDFGASARRLVSQDGPQAKSAPGRPDDEQDSFENDARPDNNSPTTSENDASEADFDAFLNAVSEDENIDDVSNDQDSEDKRPTAVTKDAISESQATNAPQTAENTTIETPSGKLTETVTSSQDLTRPTVTKTEVLKNRDKFLPRQKSDKSSQVSKAFQTCKANKQVMFLKTHKTGSTTVSNIILRFAYANDLRVALPAVGDTSLHTCKGPRYDVIKRMMNKCQAKTPACFLWDHHDKRVTYDIIAHHWTYDRAIARASMPANAFYVTIIREPFSRFKSAFSYGNYARKLNIQNNSDPMLLFLRTATGVGAIPSGMNEGKLNKAKTSLRNNMMRDLGFQRYASNNIISGSNYIKLLDSDFDLVLLTEDVNTGMILMRRRLCWDMKDVIYLKMNAQTSYKSRVQNKSMEVLEKLLSNWSSLDYQLYEHFRAKFEAEKKMQDEDFWAELAYYEDLLKRISNYCFSEEQEKVTSVFKVPPNEWTRGFTLNAKDCAYMQLFSHEFSVLLKEQFYNQVSRFGKGFIRYNEAIKKLNRKQKLE